jgi:flagellar hook protein FlgE
MSILGAMYAAVAGLGAQSTKLGAISDNIANTSTTGYKRVEVEFASLVTEQVSRRSYSAGGVAGSVRRRVDSQGLLQATGSSTDIAINGDGFCRLRRAERQPAAGPDGAHARRQLHDRRPGLPAQRRRLLPDGLRPQSGRHDGQSGSARDALADVEPVNVAGINFTGAPTTEVTFGNLPAQLANGTPGTPISTQIQYFTELGNPAP